MEHAQADEGTTVDQLIVRLTEVFSMLSAGEARFVELVGQLDRVEGWADGRTRSCAHWLNWKLGIAMPAARERVRVARALRDLPALADAFADGRLSYSKVRAVTRVATPATESTLLGFALYATAAQLERICRTWRQVRAATRPDAETRQRESQRFDVFLTDDAMLDVTASLPTDVGVLLAKALAKASTRLFADRGPAEDGEDRRIEALRAICESFLAGGPAAGPSSADIWQVVVHTDADALARAVSGVPASHDPASAGMGAGDGVSDAGVSDGVASDGVGGGGAASDRVGVGGAALDDVGEEGAVATGRCHADEGQRLGSVGTARRADAGKGEGAAGAEASQGALGAVGFGEVGGIDDHGLGRVEDGPVLARSVLARLACDATLVGQVDGAADDLPDGQRQPLGIGRRHRTIPGWLRRLVHQRDPGCQFPGCPNTTWTDVHHIVHWAAGGPTDLHNLVRLCRFHHTGVHRLGIGIARSGDDRSWTFTTADGDPIEPPVLPSARGALPPGAGLQLWEGDPARMALIIDALVQAAGPGTDVSAETPGGPDRDPDLDPEPDRDQQLQAA